jgi:hypothetical protein
MVVRSSRVSATSGVATVSDLLYEGGGSIDPVSRINDDVDPVWWIASVWRQAAIELSRSANVIVACSDVDRKTREPLLSGLGCEDRLQRCSSDRAVGIRFAQVQAG